ncbi:hypothetical protein [Marinilabilia sp.]|uniref:hypothetical protein n=1 Tax=Marinilabilia sp. TaxID=2021252 RepID=UPI0025B9B122|nr:hypothetical protein [Marinilabilia sp.]
MIRKLLILIFLGLFLIVGNSEGQIWPFKNRSQAEKATEDLNKRRQDAGQGNLFNPLQTTDPNNTDLRDDHIWAAGSAATSYQKAGNLSLSSASRYGLSQGVELQTWLGLDYWIPNVFVKREISRGDIWVSSLHGAYSAWPGLNRVSANGGPFPADSLSGVPLTLSIKNQLMVSKPFYDVMDCNPHQPFLVFTGFLALDYGFAFSEEEIYIEEQHLITPRSRAYTGKGLHGTLGFRGDWRINPALYARGELRSLIGNFPAGVAFEQQSSVEYFPYRNFSVSGGYIVGLGRVGPRLFTFWPFVDISIYFGRKQGRKRGLFGQTMF